MKHALRNFGVLVLAFCLMAGFAAAMEPTPLPAIQLSTLDGQTIKTADLPGKGNWLLIYVNSKSRFCDEMLKQLKKEQYPDLAGNAVIVVNGSSDDAKGLQAKYPDLATALWYTDSSRDAFNQLKLHGMPVVVGISNQTMKWVVNGVIPDPDTFRSVLNSWLKQPAPQKTT